MRFRLKTHTFYPFSPSVHINTIENGGICLRKRRFSKTLSRVEVFENGGAASLCGRAKTEVFENGASASLCGRAKTEVFENDYVTGIDMSQLKNKTDVFLSVFGGLVWTVENAAKTLVWTKNFLSVFKKQKTEVFENALVWTGPPFSPVHKKTLNLRFRKPPFSSIHTKTLNLRFQKPPL